MICTAAVSRHEGGLECGFSATQIAAGVEPSDNNGTFDGIVPDGVATVTVFWRAAHAGERSATTSVVGNMYALRASRTSGFDAVAVKVIWRSAQGNVMKTMSPPSARALAQYCSQHPAPCAAVQTGQMTESSSSSSGASFRGVAAAPPSVSESSSSGTATQAGPPPSGSGG